MKKNFLTKMGAVLVSVAMLLSGVTAVCAEDTAVEATDGYFWLEGEDGTGYGEWYDNSNASFNGGKFKAISTENEAAGGNRITYKINVTEAGKYKAYVNGTWIENAQWNSAAKLYIDDTEIALTKLTSEVWSTWSFAWYSGAETALEAGEHTVTYKLEAPRTADNKVYYGALDSIAIMPVDYTMTPKVGERPVSPTYLQPTDGYFWLESEDGVRSGSWAKASNAAFSGGNWRYAVSQETPSNGWTIKYFIDVPETGEYTAYLLGSSVSNAWASPTKLYIDDTPITLSAHSGDLGWDNQVPYAWNKANMSITAGKHSVTYKIESKRSGDGLWYCGGLDFITIMPSDYSMAQDVNARPVAPKTYISQWLEETDAATKSGAFYSVSDAGLSEGKALQMSDPNAPGSEGYKIDFQTNIKETGEYDIYYRGNIPNEWMSKPDLLVDGEKQESTAVKDEGWFGQLTLGWNKATVELSKGQHTIRFALIDSRAANTNTWIGMFDCMVILPKGSPFNITANGIADTKIEYELCAAMAGVNLSAVTSDITLPSETESGAAITWTSSDTDVITNDGKVTRGNTDKEVKLTAVTGDYEKTFTVTVKKLVEFDVDSFTLNGNVTAGETLRANAEVRYNMGTSKNVTLIIALYKADGEMISANIDTKDITAAGDALSTTLTVPSDISEGAYAAAYLWNDINDLKPIVPSIGK